MNFQNNWWRFADNLFILDDCGTKNGAAYARLDVNEIHYGVRLFQDTALKFNDIVVNFGILAHEKAHRLQVHQGFFLPNQKTHRVGELEADAFSGFYMNWAKSLTAAQLANHLELLYSKGDDGYYDEDHHGTWLERKYMALYGMAIAENYGKLGRTPTFKELHDNFIAEITRQGFAPPDEVEALQR